MTEKAVSPVIGVLLMLTLTLIIAAIVNTYAGSMISTQPPSPMATVQATYHQNGPGMEIRHLTGDPLPTSGVTLLIRPSETMGSTAGQQISEINKTLITSSTGEQSWTSGITSLKAGEMSFILGSQTTGNLTRLQDGITEEKYWLNTTANLGNTFYLEIYDKNTRISKTEVLIER